MKKILLILGHPSKDSFNNALLESYQKGAIESAASIEHIYISDLDFEPNLGAGYNQRKENQLEEDLKLCQTKIKNADHIVFAYPTWWGTMPALTKGLIDRCFLSGFAFKHHKDKVFQEKLLKGKSIRLLVTMDSPKLWFYLVFRAAQYRMLRQLVFEYVGISPVRFTTFGGMRTSSSSKRKKWLIKVESIGKKLR